MADNPSINRNPAEIFGENLAACGLNAQEIDSVCHQVLILLFSGPVNRMGIVENLIMMSLQNRAKTVEVVS